MSIGTQIGQPSVRIQVLGRFWVEVDGVSVPSTGWGHPAAEVMLKCLAVRQGAAVTASALAGAIWPADRSIREEHLKELQHAGVALRGAIGELRPGSTRTRLVQWDRGVFWLDTPSPACSLDSLEFERLIASADAGWLTAPYEALRDYLCALGLYRGHLLAGEPGSARNPDMAAPGSPLGDWIAEAREALREKHMGVVMKCATLLSEKWGDHQQASSVCERALKLEPHREEIYEALIGALMKAGRLSEAATRYRECEQMLASQFQLQPGPELLTLNRELHRLGAVPSVSLAPVAPIRTAALSCDRKAFEFAVALEQRRQVRRQEPFATARFTAPGRTPAERSKFLGAVCATLRQGDIVCAWDQQTIAAQLEGVGAEEAKVIMRRVERALANVGLPKCVSDCLVFAPGAEPPDSILPDAPHTEATDPMAAGVLTAVTDAAPRPQPTRVLPSAYAGLARKRG